MVGWAVAPLGVIEAASELQQLEWTVTAKTAGRLAVRLSSAALATEPMALAAEVHRVEAWAVPMVQGTGTGDGQAAESVVKLGSAQWRSRHPT